jgi:protein-disulfide isomerase
LHSDDDASCSHADFGGSSTSPWTGTGTGAGAGACGPDGVGDGDAGVGGRAVVSVELGFDGPEQPRITSNSQRRRMPPLYATTGGMSRLALLGLVALNVAGCYRTKHDDTTPDRLARIEQRLDAQDKAIAEMAQRTQEIEVGLLAKKIEDINAKLDSIQAMAARPTVGAAPPMPSPRRTVQDPAATYAVPLGNSPSLGSAKAKVTMVMAFEFACPYCRKAWDTVDALRKKYGKDLRVVYKTLIVHPSIATAASNAACAANRQGRWRQMADLLWVKAFDARQFDQSNIDEIAVEAGLDMRHYQADIAGPCPQEIKDDAAIFKKLSVTATPTFFINGRYMAGARDIADFQALIDVELKKANAAIGRGVKPEKVYETEVLAKGATEITAP